MKQSLFIIAALLLIAATIPQSPVKKSSAEANLVDGYYIFMQCKPLHEYEVIGTVKKTGVTWSGQPSEMYNTLIRRMKKEFPKADGIIFDDVEMEHATCIMFK